MAIKKENTIGNQDKKTSHSHTTNDPSISDIESPTPCGWWSPASNKLHRPSESKAQRSVSSLLRIRPPHKTTSDPNPLLNFHGFVESKPDNFASAYIIKTISCFENITRFQMKLQSELEILTAKIWLCHKIVKATSITFCFDV